MPNPTIKWWQVTGTGSISNMNASGGCTATQLTTSPLDFGNTQGGLWSVPQVFLIEFAGSTAHNLNLRVYDTDSNVDSPIVTTLGANLFGDSPPWQLHMTFLANWSDPTNASTFNTDPASSPMNSWPALSYGASVLSLDSNRPSTGNDGTTNLLTASVAGDSTRHLTNFFIYMSVLPPSSAPAGTNAGWGLRLAYVYP